MISVSVIIPAYNAEKFIVETIQSLQRQTFSDFEIIVIDDGSTDQTASLVMQIKEPRLRVLSVEHQGLSATRNRGVAASQGEFIAFLDADDLWTANALELHIEALAANSEADLSYGWTYFWNYDLKNASDKTKLIAPRATGTTAYREMLERNIVGNGSNIFVRRSAFDAVGGFDQTLTHGEDWEFCFRVALQGEVALVPQALVYYRQHSTSMCSDFEPAKISFFTALDKIYDLAPPEYKTLKVKVQSSMYIYIANLYLTRTNTKAGIQSARKNWIDGVLKWPSNIFKKQTVSVGIKLFIFSMFPSKFSKTLLQILDTKAS
jgi:glycosyltransferase involved in cell wall biosynthesis